MSARHLSGISTGPEQRTPEQNKALALSHVLIDELLWPTLLCPRPDAQTSSALDTKSLIDHVEKRRVLMVLTQNAGPEGSSWANAPSSSLPVGVYSDGPARPLDFQEPHSGRFSASSASLDIDAVPVEGSRHERNRSRKSGGLRDGTVEGVSLAQVA